MKKIVSLSVITLIVLFSYQGLARNTLQAYFQSKSLDNTLVSAAGIPSQQGDEEEHTHVSEENESDSLAVLPADESVPGTQESVFARLSEFPNLHPLIVHFPIVLLLLAFFTQLIGLITKREKLSWITLFLLIGGFVGAVLAVQVFHAHAEGLPERVNRIFEAHEYYGEATVWLSGIALLLKVISHFWLKRKTWAEVIVFLIIAGSAITVSLAGHLGSQMVHIENVGPQGNNLGHDEEH